MTERKNFSMHVQEGPKGFFMISPELCKGCGLCPEKCPVKVIKWSKELGIYGTPIVEADVKGCIACGTCQSVCPECAIKIVQRKKVSPEALAHLHKNSDKEKSYYE